ncbi:MAG: glucosaminidase domain-containing protein, partial [Clostridia bacterium]|nr:glucosaminidase domain-containing protein [Clostridia bacterium]
MHPRSGMTRTGAVLIAAVLLFSCASVLPGSFRARADVASNIQKLSGWQQSFLRVISSLALKDAYDADDGNGNHVFASITAGQALYEGGWARYGISVIANNQYGIKAYSSWKGKVFDNKTYMVYGSYQELASIQGAHYAKHCNLWRAYDSWDESVADHSALFYNEKKYAAFLKAVDYKDAARKVVE